jgi:YidC/Oxa1 family membrane protein insertase
MTPTKASVTDFIKNFILWFAIFYLSFSLFQQWFGDDKDAEKTPEIVQAMEVLIEPENKKYSIGSLVTFKVENTGSETVSFTSSCGNTDVGTTAEIYRLVNGKRLLVEDFSNCETSELADFTLDSAQGMRVSFPYQNDAAFGEEGDYFLRLVLESESGENLDIESTPIKSQSIGFIKRAFRTVISKPLFNLLVFFTQTVPGKSFGVAIILVTILVRLLLFIPNQKSLQSQRKLQKLQPQMQAIRKKYAKNQQMIAMKTMELYRTAKVNPMSSCLPMILQLPMLLGVYYIVQDGLSPHLRFLLYPFQALADLAGVNSMFLGYNLQLTPIGALDWTVLDTRWLYLLIPVVVAVTQWFAIRMSLARANNQKKVETKKPNKKKKEVEPSNDMAAQMQQMTGMMQWLMPGMIAFFTATFPAAVGLYWFTSTLFGIVQQKYVYWKMDQTPEVRKKI